MCDSVDANPLAYEDIRKENPESIIMDIARCYGSHHHSIIYDLDKAVGLVDKAMGYHSGSEKFPSRDDLSSYRHMYLMDAG